MSFEKAEKTYYTFSKGINTDASPINFPDDFSLDEQNFILKLDGTRRRRRGLTTETGGSQIQTVDALDGEVFQTFHWSNISNNPGNDLIGLQQGSKLYFFKDCVEAPSGDQSDLLIDLAEYKTIGSTDTQVKESRVDIAFGRGHLFIVGAHINPIFVKYSGDDEEVTITPFELMERDFEGVNDGVGNTIPMDTLTDSHEYNLKNSGWTSEMISAFHTDLGYYPPKNMIPYLGFAGQDTANVAEIDWTKEFSPDYLVSQLFQDAPAPMGHIIRSPFTNSDIAEGLSGIPILTWDRSGTTFTIQTDGAHGLSLGDGVRIQGHASYYNTFTGEWHNGEPVDHVKLFTLNGARTVASVPAADQFTITATIPPPFLGWTDQYSEMGTVSVTSISNPDGLNALKRPTNVAFFAGRVWYAGTPYEKLGNRIYFSQVIESDLQYAKCYQVADPTQKEFNILVDTDGGVIVIPEMAQLVQMIPYSNSLLLYATNGVWQIGPGQNGYFTATSYSVRKISEIGAVGSLGVVMAENIPHYFGAAGIYQILQDPNQGFLYIENISVGVIDNLYNSIPIEAKRNAQAVFNPVSKQLMWLYKSSTGGEDSKMDTVLIYDTRLGAFTKWALGTDGDYLPVTILCIKDLVENDGTGPIRILGSNLTGDTLSFGALESTSFTDWGSTESPAFMTSGYDTSGNAGMYKYGIWVHVFMGKTETGYTQVGDELVPVNESSMTLQARWDWADNTAAGKWGTAQQIYRHRRLYTPSGPGDTFDDGQPVVVTKNKIRGRGRSLHLKFQAGTGKDSWLLGWQAAIGGMTTY